MGDKIFISEFERWKVGKKFPPPGATFGLWTVLREMPPIAGKPAWPFQFESQCRCGFKKVSVVSELRFGPRACASCLPIIKLEKKEARSRAAGLKKIWKGMLERCQRKKHKAYHRYGGRGIKVCARWLEFKNFFADMGLRPQGLTIDRIDNDGDYEPGNCRWATQREQMGNTRKNNWIVVDGRRMHATDWSRETGVHVATIKNRLASGWSERDAVTTPPDQYANSPQGSRSPYAKLTEAAVAEMRKLHSTGAYGYRRLGKKFGVSVETARAAIRGETWRHVGGAPVDPKSFEPL